MNTIEERRDCIKCDHYETRCLHDFGDWFIKEPSNFNITGINRRDCKKCDHFDSTVRFEPAMLFHNNMENSNNSTWMRQIMHINPLISKGSCITFTAVDLGEPNRPPSVNSIYNGYRIVKIWDSSETSENLAMNSNRAYIFVTESDIAFRYHLYFGGGGGVQHSGRHLTIAEASNLFMNFTGISNFDFTYFHTHRARFFSNMFNGCTNIKSLDLSSFDSSEVTDMRNMFRNCPNLEFIDMSSFRTDKELNDLMMNNMFTDRNESLVILVENNSSTPITMYDRIMGLPIEQRPLNIQGVPWKTPVITPRI